MMLSYFVVGLVALLGIVLLDDDPTRVSLREWILYAVLIYAAVSFFRLYRDMLGRGRRR